MTVSHVHEQQNSKTTGQSRHNNEWSKVRNSSAMRNVDNVSVPSGVSEQLHGLPESGAQHGAAVWQRSWGRGEEAQGEKECSNKHLDFMLSMLSSLNINRPHLPPCSGSHSRPQAAHRGPVQRPAPVPVPGGEAAAGEAEDGGAAGADPPGRAQGPAVRGDLPPAGGGARDRGQADWEGPLHSAASKSLHMQPIWKISTWWVSSGDDSGEKCWAFDSKPFFH